MTKKTSVNQAVTVKRLQMKTISVMISGDAPYVQLRLSEGTLKDIAEKQASGSQTKKGSKRAPKDFQALYEQAMHVSTEGWYGIPAMAFRAALIRACSLPGVNFHMTQARMALFICADGFSADGTPLVRLIDTKPQRIDSPTRNANGALDIRPRAFFPSGWKSKVRVKFDEDTFSVDDVVNLLARAGQQVGIGEGRPFGVSSKSYGMGWGTFEIMSGEGGVA